MTSTLHAGRSEGQRPHARHAAAVAGDLLRVHLPSGRAVHLLLHDAPAGHEWADPRAGAEAWLTTSSPWQRAPFFSSPGASGPSASTPAPAGPGGGHGRALERREQRPRRAPLVPHLGPPKAVGLLLASA